VPDLEPQHLTLHGHEVRYFRAGEGPPVLLIHGVAGSATTWKPTFERLAEHYDVLAPDLPGHGRSDKYRADYSISGFAVHLRDVLVATGMQRATVVGHSLGGGIAMQLAYQHPDRVERLVLVASGGLGREVSPLLRAASLPGSELVLPLVANFYTRAWGNLINGVVGRTGLRVPAAAETWRGISSLAEPRTRRAFLRTIRSVIDVSGQAVSAKDRLYLATAVPLLIMWGERDRIIPVHHAHATHEQMPGSRLELFEHAGHFLHNEEPERFISVLRDFVETTEPATLDERAWQILLAEPIE